MLQSTNIPTSNTLENLIQDYNRLVGRNKLEDGVINASKLSSDIYKAWATYTPTITVSGGTAPTYTARFINRWWQFGKTVYVLCDWYNSTGGTAGAGANAIYVSLPVTPAQTASNTLLGKGYAWQNAGPQGTISVLNGPNDGTAFFWIDETTAAVSGANQSQSSRGISFLLTYEIA
jgi:hypothetical protein